MNFIRDQTCNQEKINSSSTSKEYLTAVIIIIPTVFITFIVIVDNQLFDGSKGSSEENNECSCRTFTRGIFEAKLEILFEYLKSNTQWTCCDMAVCHLIIGQKNLSILKNCFWNEQAFWADTITDKIYMFVFEKQTLLFVPFWKYDVPLRRALCWKLNIYRRK